MKYKIKANKQHYYEMCDWVENYNYELQDLVILAANSATYIDSGLPVISDELLLTGRKNGFNCIDWNQWDDKLGRIKDMYIEFTDLKLELIFLCSVAHCIDRNNDDTGT